MATAKSTCLDLRHQRVQRRLRIAEQHPRFVLVEKMILDARKTRRHRTLHHNHRFAAVRLNKMRNSLLLTADGTAVKTPA